MVTRPYHASGLVRCRISSQSFKLGMILKALGTFPLVYWLRYLPTLLFCFVSFRFVLFCLVWFGFCLVFVLFVLVLSCPCLVSVLVLFVLFFSFVFFSFSFVCLFVCLYACSVISCYLFVSRR